MPQRAKVQAYGECLRHIEELESIQANSRIPALESELNEIKSILGTAPRLSSSPAKKTALSAKSPANGKGNKSHSSEEISQLMVRWEALTSQLTQLREQAAALVAARSMESDLIEAIFSSPDCPVTDNLETTLALECQLLQPRLAAMLQHRSSVLKAYHHLILASDLLRQSSSKLQTCRVENEAQHSAPESAESSRNLAAVSTKTGTAVPAVSMTDQPSENLQNLQRVSSAPLLNHPANSPLQNSRNATKSMSNAPGMDESNGESSERANDPATSARNIRISTGGDRVSGGGRREGRFSAEGSGSERREATQHRTPFIFRPLLSCVCGQPGVSADVDSSVPSSSFGPYEELGHAIKVALSGISYVSSAHALAPDVLKSFPLDKLANLREALSSALKELASHASGSAPVSLDALQLATSVSSIIPDVSRAESSLGSISAGTLRQEVDRLEVEYVKKRSSLDSHRRTLLKTAVANMQSTQVKPSNWTKESL